MKNRILRTLPFICLLILLGSCEMQKRLYRNGYHVNSKSITTIQKERNAVVLSATQLNNTETVESINQTANEPLSASAANLPINTSLTAYRIKKSPIPHGILKRESIINNSNHHNTETLATDIKESFPFNNRLSSLNNEIQNSGIMQDKKRTDTLAIDAPLWVYIVLAILIGPLAIYLYEGITNRFWIDTILYGLGIGLFASFRLAGLAALAASILALLVVLDAI